MKYKKSPLLVSMFFLLNSFSAFTQDSLVIPLWKNGAPGFENKKNEPEEAKDWWVKNINNPNAYVFQGTTGNWNRCGRRYLPGRRASYVSI